MRYKNTTKEANRQKESRPLHADGFRLFHFFYRTTLKQVSQTNLPCVVLYVKLFYDIAHTA